MSICVECSHGATFVLMIVRQSTATRLVVEHLIYDGGVEFPAFHVLATSYFGEAKLILITVL